MNRIYHGIIINYVYLRSENVILKEINGSHHFSKFKNSKQHVNNYCYFIFIFWILFYKTWYSSIKNLIQVHSICILFLEKNDSNFIKFNTWTKTGAILHIIKIRFSVTVNVFIMQKLLSTTQTWTYFKIIKIAFKIMVEIIFKF